MGLESAAVSTRAEILNVATNHDFPRGAPELGEPITCSRCGVQAVWNRWVDPPMYRLTAKHDWLKARPRCAKPGMPLTEPQTIQEESQAADDLARSEERRVGQERR